MKSKYKAIFWDNDGTLVDTEIVYLKATQDTFASVGEEFDEEFYKNEHLKHNTSPFELLRRKGFSEEEIDKLRAARNQNVQNNFRQQVHVIDGVVETLGALYGNIDMAIVTSSPRRNLDLVLEATGLGRFFKFIVTTDEVKYEKPEPDLYLLALEKADLKGSECLAIEDTERGVVAAKRAGLDCFAIPNEISKHGNFEMADRVLGNAREVLEFI